MKTRKCDCCEKPATMFDIDGYEARCDYHYKELLEKGYVKVPSKAEGK